MRNPFTEHPNAVGETYLQHFVVAVKISAKLFVSALACLTHAVFPFLFTTTASTKIKELHSFCCCRSKKD